jgi:hypothetical protein
LGRNLLWRRRVGDRLDLDAARWTFDHELMFLLRAPIRKPGGEIWRTG